MNFCYTLTTCFYAPVFGCFFGIGMALFAFEVGLSTSTDWQMSCLVFVENLDHRTFDTVDEDSVCNHTVSDPSHSFLLIEYPLIGKSPRYSWRQPGPLSWKHLVGYEDNWGSPKSNLDRITVLWNEDSTPTSWWTRECWKSRLTFLKLRRHITIKSGEDNNQPGNNDNQWQIHMVLSALVFLGHITVLWPSCP